ncbi:MAG: hypothetical protein L0154_08635 [Chloroflexi bacterium]|nr:hypothetical protein [Chloroflexota bacterium]
MIRLFLITGLILSLTISITEPPPASATIITVDADCTLVDAIIAANTDMASGLCPAGSGADTIVLDLKTFLSSAYGGSTDIGGGQAGLPDITTDITIQAGLATHILGNSTDFRIFNVMNGGTLTLDGLTIRDGKIVGNPNAMGGGIYVDVGGTLALNNTTLENNTAESQLTMADAGDAYGGAIFNDGTITSISGSFIENNLALGGDSLNWGAKDGRGGGIYNRGDILLIESTSISANTSQAGDGSEFGGFAFGGGIYNEGSITTISNSTISQNIVTASDLFAAVLEGGGIYNSGSIGSILSTDTNENQIANVYCKSPMVCEGNVFFLGGGVYNIGSINMISGASVSNNSFSGSVVDGLIQGGGIYNDGIITLLEECQVDGNTMNLPDIIDNALVGGAGLINLGNINAIETCSFSYNTIDVALLPTNDTFIQGGGFFHNTMSSLSMNDISIVGNHIQSSTPATPPSGLLYVFGGAATFHGANVTLSNAVISNNVVDGTSLDDLQTDGALLVEGDNHTVINITVSENQVIYHGTGGSWRIAGVLVAEPAVFEHVTIIKNTVYDGMSQEPVDLLASDLTLNGSLVGTVEFCDTFTGSNNLTTEADVPALCPGIFNGTFTIGTDVDATLQDNGGSTLTHALVMHGGNPAIDGNPGCGLATDQRGVARDANCDIGAFEAGMLQNAALLASATCNGPDLDVTITSGDALFSITASAGINTPVMGAGLGTTTIAGPEKWDNLTVIETSGDTESINLGQFKCRSDERPVPLMPAHRSHTTDTTPTFSWMGITDANNYRVFIFDDANPATRTVDIRQNSGGPTSLTPTTPLPTTRLFWRVRGRQNRVWSLWSIRFTLFVDAVVFAPNVQQDVVVPTVAATPVPLPTIIAPPNDRAAPTLPAPPNSR